jgi:hypothetical protein
LWVRTRRFAGGHDRAAASPHRDIEGGGGKGRDNDLERDHDSEQGHARTAARGAPFVAVHEF